MLLLAASMRFLKMTGDGYCLTKKGHLLTQRLKNWIRHYLLVWGEQIDPAILHFEEYLLTGENAFKFAHKDTIWDYYDKNPAQGANFVAFMHGVTHQSHLPRIVAELNVGAAKSLVDGGSLACALSGKYPRLESVVCDQPSNKVNADATLQSAV